MLEIFNSLRKKMLNEEFGKGQVEDRVDLSKAPDSGVTDKNPEETMPEVKPEDDTSSEELDNGLKEGEKIYLGNTFTDHYYVVFQDGDLLITDAAGNIKMSGKDKMGEDFDPKAHKSQIEFLKAAASEIKPNISVNTLERFDFFTPEVDEPESTMGEEVPVLGAGSDGGMPASATGAGNPANPVAGDEAIAQGGDNMEPEPPKRDYKPLSKETDATGLDQLTVDGQEATPEVVDAPDAPLKANKTASGMDENNPEAIGASSETGRTPNPAYRRTVESVNEGKVAVGAKTCPKCGDDLTDTGNRDDKGVTCGGCGKSFKVDESVNEARVNLIYNMDLDALNDIYMEQGGQTDIEAALDAFEPLAMKLARQTIEGELYYFGAQNAAVVSVEPRLDSGKYMSGSKYLDVIVDVPDTNSLTQLDAKGSPFQVSGGDRMAESLFVKFGITEKKESEPEVEDKEDNDNQKIVNTVYKEALRGLDGKEATRADIQNELEAIAKYVDAASPVKHIVYMKLLKKFRRAKPVEETNDSDRVKMGYEQSLEEKLKELSNKFIL